MRSADGGRRTAVGGRRSAVGSRAPQPWDQFYSRYPDSGGYVVFSAVGFNETKTRALVYIAHYCGNLCGGGSHHFMEKVDGRWRETRPKDVTMCMWIS